MTQNFWLLATAGCFALALLTLNRNKTKRKKQLLQLQQQWGKVITGPRDFGWIEYYSKFSSDTNRIGRQTILDLDLYDLFHYIDRTQSKPGQQYLFHQLIHPLSDMQELQLFDELCDYFTHKQSTREKVQLLLQQLNKQDAYYIAALLDDNLFEEPAWAKWLLLDQLLVAGLLVGAIWWPVLLLWSLLPFALNTFLHLWSKFRAGRYMQALPQLSTLIAVVESLSTAGLPVHHWPVAEALQNLKRFKRQFGWFKTAYAGNEMGQLVFFVTETLKALFVLETRAFIGCMRLVQENKPNINQLIVYAGRIDAAISIASVRFNSNDWSKPFLMPGEKKMMVRNLYHPLIPGCVPNSIEINGKSVLVTGSNMSGKTTFIRAMAINSLMAQTFYTCFARYYRAPFLHVHTSIRISDDLLQGKSYFLEEVDILHHFIEDAGKKEQCLFVLDEVFKGTNTLERIAAGKAVLSYLNRYNNIVLVSTHDVELTVQLKEYYDLYHFEESIQNNELAFDHVLKKGPLTRQNAIRLLQLKGYPEGIISEAQQVVKELQNAGY